MKVMAWQSRHIYANMAQLWIWMRLCKEGVVMQMAMCLYRNVGFVLTGCGYANEAADM